jgi:hypothetical protein
MNQSLETHARRALSVAAVLSFGASVALAVAFQLSKTSAISAISPFAEDPPDLVASIGFQVALAGGLIGLIRWMRVQGDVAFSPDRARLALRGCALAVAALGAVVLTDSVAVALAPLPGTSPWEAVLIGGLASIAAIGLAAGVATLSAVPAVRAAAGGEVKSGATTLADLFDDGLVVARRLGEWLAPRLPLPGRLAAWLTGLAGRVLGWLNATPISPRAHPWRFAFGVGLACGACLLLAKIVLEGPPPNLVIGLLIVAIFVGAELAAVAGGYLLLGGWLGIRPPLGRRG